MSMSGENKPPSTIDEERGTKDRLKNKYKQIKKALQGDAFTGVRSIFCGTFDMTLPDRPPVQMEGIIIQVLDQGTLLAVNNCLKRLFGQSPLGGYEDNDVIVTCYPPFTQ